MKLDGSLLVTSKQPKSQIGNAAILISVTSPLSVNGLYDIQAVYRAFRLQRRCLRSPFHLFTRSLLHPTG